jgi:hypothetical protein
MLDEKADTMTWKTAELVAGTIGGVAQVLVGQPFDLV